MEVGREGGRPAYRVLRPEQALCSWSSTEAKRSEQGGEVLRGEVEDVTGARSTLSPLGLSPFTAGYSVLRCHQCFCLGPDMSALGSPRVKPSPDTRHPLNK